MLHAVLRDVACSFTLRMLWCCIKHTCSVTLRMLSCCIKHTCSVTLRMLWCCIKHTCSVTLRMLSCCIKSYASSLTHLVLRIWCYTSGVTHLLLKANLKLIGIYESQPQVDRHLCIHVCMHVAKDWCMLEVREMGMKLELGISCHDTHTGIDLERVSTWSYILSPQYKKKWLSW